MTATDTIYADPRERRVVVGSEGSWPISFVPVLVGTEVIASVTTTLTPVAALMPTPLTGFVVATSIDDIASDLDCKVTVSWNATVLTAGQNYMLKVTATVDADTVYILLVEIEAV